MEKNLAEIYNSGDGKYLLVNVAAKRIRKLLRGDKLLVATEATEDLNNIVMKEIAAGKLKIVPKRKTGKVIDLAKQQ